LGLGDAEVVRADLEAEQWAQLSARAGRPDLADAGDNVVELKAGKDRHRFAAGLLPVRSDFVLSSGHFVGL
jgi:hypothetical protein